MPVICSSLVNVIRARKAMQAAFESGDWEAVRVHDEQVGQLLDLAFSDELRDNRALVGELEKVLALYADVVAYLPESAAQRWLKASH